MLVANGPKVSRQRQFWKLIFFLDGSIMQRIANLKMNQRQLHLKIKYNGMGFRLYLFLML
jgi:hypothetical protein